MPALARLPAELAPSNCRSARICSISLCEKSRSLSTPMSTADTVESPESLRQRVADLERELRFKDQRITELRTEIDETRELVREFEERAQGHDEYLETFVSAFGMEVDADGCWRW